jgi:hypothetical protein
MKKSFFMKFFKHEIVFELLLLFYCFLTNFLFVIRLAMPFCLVICIYDMDICDDRIGISGFRDFVFLWFFWQLLFGFGF